jgi:hypothetical protein
MSAQTSASAMPAYAARQAELIAAKTTLSDWLALVRAEYLEIPGLHLTRDQVRRLWSLDDVTCDSLLRTLVDVGFLRQTEAGAYVRADVGGG